MTALSRSRRRGAIAAGVALAAAVAALVAFNARSGARSGTGGGDADAGQTPAGADAGAARAIVTRGPFEKTLVLHGRLTATRSERLKVPVVSGWRTTVKWLAAEGTRVAPGDAVAQLDASTPAADLADLENRIGERLQQLVVLEADTRRADLDAARKVEQAELEFQKARIDAAVPGSVSGERNHQERQLALQKARAKRDEAQRAQRADKARLDADTARARLELDGLRERHERLRREVEAMTLRAGESGVVVHAEHPWLGRKIRVGENLQSTFPVVEIPDPASLEVEAFVPESEAGAVRAGQPVTLRLDAYPTRTLRGTVVEIAGRGEQRPEWGRAFYFRARIALEALALRDPDLLRPGMSVQCAVLVDSRPDVLRVPLTAARTRGSAFSLRPRGRAPLEVTPLAVSESFIALPADQQGLAAGDVLEAPGA